MNDDNKKNIIASNLGLIDKFFLATIAAWIVGEKTNINLRGNRDEIETIVCALISTKELNDEIKKENTSIEDIISKLKTKKEFVKKFEDMFKIPFPG